MSIKIKMLKNLISVLCAATIATSGVVTSVSATKTTGNTSSTSTNKKEELKSKYNEAKENYQNFSEVEGSLDKIKNSKAIIRSASDIAVEFVKLCDICEKIVNPVNGDEISEDKVVEAIGKLDRFNKRVTTLLGKIMNMLSTQESEQEKQKWLQINRLQDIARKQELVQTKRQRDRTDVYVKVVNKKLELEEFMGRNKFNGDTAAAWRMIFFDSAWQAFEDEYKVLCEGKISPDAHNKFIERANKLIQRLDRFKRKYGIDKLMQGEAIYDEAKENYNEALESTCFFDEMGNAHKVSEGRLNNIDMKFVQLSGMYGDEISKAGAMDGVINKLDKFNNHLTKLIGKDVLAKQESVEQVAQTKRREDINDMFLKFGNKYLELETFVMNNQFNGDDKKYSDAVSEMTVISYRCSNLEEKFAALRKGEISDDEHREFIASGKRIIKTIDRFKRKYDIDKLMKHEATSKFTDALSKPFERIGMNAMKANDQEIKDTISKFKNTISKGVKRNVINKIAKTAEMNAALKEKQKEFEALYSNFEKVVAKDFLSWAEQQNNVYQQNLIVEQIDSIRNGYPILSEKLKGAKTLEELNHQVKIYKHSMKSAIQNMERVRKNYEKARALAKQLAEESIRNEEIEKNRKANEEKERIAKEQKENMEREQKQKFINAKKEVKDKFENIITGDDYLSLTLIKNDEVSEIEKMKQKIEKELNSLTDPAKDMDKVSGLNNEVEKFGRAVKELAGKLAGKPAQTSKNNGSNRNYENTVYLKKLVRKSAQTSKNNGVKNNDDVLREKFNKKIEEFDKKCNQALQKLEGMPKDEYWVERVDYYPGYVKHTVEDEQKRIYLIINIINKGKSNFEKAKSNFQSNMFEKYCEAIDTYIEELDRSIKILNTISNGLGLENKDGNEKKKTDRVAKKKTDRVAKEKKKVKFNEAPVLSN